MIAFIPVHLYNMNVRTETRFLIRLFLFGVDLLPAFLFGGEIKDEIEK